MAKNILVVDDAAFMRMMIKDILTKNGYGASVLISLDLYDKAFAKQELYAKIAQAEKDIDEDKGRDAFEALDEIRAELGV